MPTISVLLGAIFSTVSFHTNGAARPVKEQGEGRPITIEDIFRTTRIDRAKISPDGKWVAFITSEPSHTENRLLHQLNVVASNGSQPARRLFEGALSSFDWRPDSSGLSFLMSKGGSLQVWAIGPNGGEPQPITNVSAGITSYAWAPDGTLALLITTEPEDSDKQKAREQGLPFPDGNNNAVEKPLLTLSSVQELWLGDAQGRNLRKIRSFPKTQAIGLVGWYDARTVTLTRQKTLVPGRDRFYLNSEMLLIDVESGSVRSAIPWTGTFNSAKLSPDRRRLAVWGVHIDSDGLFDYGQKAYILDVLNGPSREVELKPPGITFTYILGWTLDGSALYVQGRPRGRSVQGLFKVPLDGTPPKWLHDREGHFTQLSLSADQRTAAGVMEAPTKWPQVVTVDLASGRSRVLTNLNSYYKDVRLSDAQELLIRNKYGTQSSSFLIKPLNYEVGQRYPLLVALYRFSGEFFVDFLGNYPIQKFAADGFAVLLVNIVESPYHIGNFREASLGEMYGPMSTIEESVKTAVNMGVADPKRLGLMGWSYGSFLTDFTLTHLQPPIFSVAASGDSGIYNPATYWYGEIYNDGIFGGPPAGDTLKNWIEISPEMNARRVSIPVLFEYTSQNARWANFYFALKRYGAPAELVVYPDGQHVFNDGLPSQRRASLERNSDWFNFWLQDKEDPEPGKHDQYVRWRSLRELTGKRTTKTLRE